MTGSKPAGSHQKGDRGRGLGTSSSCDVDPVNFISVHPAKSSRWLKDLQLFFERALSCGGQRMLRAAELVGELHARMLVTRDVVSLAVESLADMSAGGIVSDHIDAIIALLERSATELVAKPRGAAVLQKCIDHCDALLSIPSLRWDETDEEIRQEEERNRAFAASLNGFRALLEGPAASGGLPSSRCSATTAAAPALGKEHLGTPNGADGPRAGSPSPKMLPAVDSVLAAAVTCAPIDVPPGLLASRSVPSIGSAVTCFAANAALFYSPLNVSKGIDAVCQSVSADGPRAGSPLLTPTHIRELVHGGEHSCTQPGIASVAGPRAGSPPLTPTQTGEPTSIGAVHSCQTLSVSGPRGGSPPLAFTHPGDLKLDSICCGTESPTLSVGGPRAGSPPLTNTMPSALAAMCPLTADGWQQQHGTGCEKVLTVLEAGADLKVLPRGSPSALAATTISTIGSGELLLGTAPPCEPLATTCAANGRSQTDITCTSTSLIESTCGDTCHSASFGGPRAGSPPMTPAEKAGEAADLSSPSSPACALHPEGALGAAASCPGRSTGLLASRVDQAPSALVVEGVRGAVANPVLEAAMPKGNAAKFFHMASGPSTSDDETSIPASSQDAGAQQRIRELETAVLHANQRIAVLEELVARHTSPVPGPSPAALSSVSADNASASCSDVEDASSAGGWHSRRRGPKRRRKKRVKQPSRQLFVPTDDEFSDRGVSARRSSHVEHLHQTILRRQELHHQLALLHHQLLVQRGPAPYGGSAPWQAPFSSHTSSTSPPPQSRTLQMSGAPYSQTVSPFFATSSSLGRSLTPPR